MKATVDSGAFFKALNRVIPLLKVSAIPALSEASIQFRDVHGGKAAASVWLAPCPAP